jgi:uncharacterized protein
MPKAALLLAVVVVACQPAPVPVAATTAQKACASDVCAGIPADEQVPSGTAVGALNVDGTPLQVCSLSPLTGWQRDGFCRTDANDVGVHTVCAAVTERFLAFTKTRGNDLTSPRGSFAGLKPGDHWCLCADRYAEAAAANAAPTVVREASHASALHVVGAGF